MSAKTKIVVLHMKELIYTGIFVVVGIFLLLLMLFLFLPGTDEPSSSNTENAYIPGNYHTTMTLNGMQVDVEVAVDANHINSISLCQLQDAVTTMYPLLEPTFDTLQKQVCEAQSVDQITYDEDAKYTSLVILHAIETSLKKATPITDMQ